MTDLAARIADTVKAIDDDGKRFVTVKVAVDRWLFLDMAARIEELEKALEPFAEAASSYNTNRDHDKYSIDEWGRIGVGHLRTAARALKGEVTPDQTGDSTPRSEPR
jgi:hypothetical protein